MPPSWKGGKGRGAEPRPARSLRHPGATGALPSTVHPTQSWGRAGGSAAVPVTAVPIAAVPIATSPGLEGLRGPGCRV